MSDFEELMTICEQRNVAVQTIKSLARGPWATTSPTHETWYEPLTGQDDIDRAVHWVMGRPNIFLNTVGDLDLLPKVLDAASRFEQRPDDAAMSAMLEGRSMTSLFGIGT
jgi:hypothetical protein